MRCQGLRASIANFSISIEDATTNEVKRVLTEIAKTALPDTDELAREARQLSSDRFDRYLTPYYQRLAFARRFLGEEELVALIGKLVTAKSGSTSSSSTPITEKVASSF